jgi:hypothetical protein
MDQTLTNVEREGPAYTCNRKPPASPLIAPLLHTLVFIAVLLANSWLSAHTPHHVAGANSKVFLYLRNIGWECLAVLYVWLGTRRRIRWRELVSGRWNSVGDALRDFALGALLWLVILTVIASLAAAMGMLQGDAAHRINEARQRLSFLIPRSGAEVLLFICMSAAAGICEEIVFRGYLLRQFTALTRCVPLAVALQAVLFGAAHGYQGGQRMVLIAAEGVLLGAVALWRRSLRPSMAAHALQDVISGLVARHSL